VRHVRRATCNTCKCVDDKCSSRELARTMHARCEPQGLHRSPLHPDGGVIVDLIVD
jgi:hypothetical protein